MKVRRNSGTSSTGSGPQSTETPRRSLAASLHVTRRTLQCALGLLWILDGLLKFQPNLLKPSFVSDVISPMATGQPRLIGSTIGHMANFLSHEATMWVAVFGLVEIAIGVGLLFRRSVKPALVASFIWGAGIYLFGEGFGMVFTGQTSPLQGAPGAVCFYVLLGLLVWPKPEDSTDVRMGSQSSAAGRGIFGGTGSLLVWAGIWIFQAIIWLFPFNRTTNAVTNQMADTANGEPGWYAHFLNSFGHAFVGAGVWVAVILAALSMVIGLGPLISKRPGPYIGLGIALALLYWVTGEGVGELLTFSGTDPNNGPLLALIGLSVLPTVSEPASEPTPAARFLAANPLGALSTLLAIVLVPSAVAIIPASTAVSASAATSASAAPSSMSGMSMSGSGGMKGTSATPARAHSTKVGHAPPMNMAGMAGLGVTDPHWKYTGPALPAAEVAQLTTVSATTDEGHKMQTPNCDAAPTSDQVLGATQYVQATSAAVAKYKDLSAAKAAGYFPITNPNYPVVHYLNPSYMNMKDLMNPNTVDSLVYATTPYGPVLVAAMYLMPGQGSGPMPYGCLVQWHQHTNLCTSAVTHLIDGFTPCPPGTFHYGPTPMMTHVWQVPVAGGPLAIDPSDLQVVQAAVMAQQQGLAPTTTGVLPGSTAAG
jgi:hypothetical protein